MDGAVYMKLFFSYGKTFSKLPDEDAGQLVKAMLHYAETGEAIPPESPMADLAFDFIKAQIDRDNDAFRNGSKGGRPRRGTVDAETENPGSETQKLPLPETETPLSENENPSLENQEPYKGIKVQRDKGVIKTTTTTRTREADTAFGRIDIDPVIVKVQKELNGLTDTHYDLLAQYRTSLGDDLVSFAVDQAVAQGVRKWAYVERILTSWQEKGIRTVGDAKAEDEKRRKASGPGKPQKTVTAQRFPQRQYDEKQLEEEVFGDFLRQAGVKSG